MIEKQLLKTILIRNNKYKRQILDFKLWADQGYILNIAMSARGLGKTFNAKEFALDEFIKYGRKSAWIINTEVIWREMKKDFIRLNNLEYPERWENVMLKRDGCYLNGERFIRFVALSRADEDKNNREIMDYIFWDEINTSLHVVRNVMNSNFTTIKSTFSSAINIPTCFLFCNMKSLALDFFNKLGITHHTLQNEWTTKEKRKIKIWSCFVPKVDIQNVKKNLQTLKAKQNYELEDMLGTIKENIFNLNDFDNTKGIIKNIDKFISKHNFQKQDTVIKIKDNYYFIYTKEKVKKYGLMFIPIQTSKNDVNFHKIICGRKSEMEINVDYDDELRERILIGLQKGLIYFPNINVKLDFISIL